MDPCTAMRRSDDELATTQPRHQLPPPALANVRHDMDGSFHFHAGLADPTAFRPSLRSSRSETRVTSDPVKKSQSHSHKHKHKSSRHHHDSHDGHHHHSSSRRHAAKEAMQSAIQIQPPASFGDLLRQARGSRDTSPSHSRRQSIGPRQGDGSASGREESTPGITIPPRRPLRPADIELEARRVKARERLVCVTGDPLWRHTRTKCSLTWHTGTFVLPSSPSRSNLSKPHDV